MSGLGMDQDMESPYESLAKWRDKAARQKEQLAGQARSIVRLKKENAKLRHDMSEALSRMVNMEPPPVIIPDSLMSDIPKREPTVAWKIGAIWFGLGVLSGYFMV